MANPRILVAIPCYNCEQQINRVLQGFDKNLLSKVAKVMVIDNGSHDKTIEVAKVSAKKINSKKIEVWRNVSNYNLGGTHKVAFLAGEKLGMDYVAILHGDDQAQTQELNFLIDTALENSQLGAVLGCRFMRGSKLQGYNWKRVWGNRAINAIFSLVTLRASKDLGSGLNLFRLSDLADHHYIKFEDTITFNIDLLLDYYRKKTALRFVPITWKEEDQVSNARNFRVGFTALKKLLDWRFHKEKRINHTAKYYKSEKV